MEITQVEKDKLIKLFVSYYGEQYKDYITKKINGTTFVTVSSLVSTQKKFSADMFSITKQSEDQYGEIKKEIGKLTVKQDIEISDLEGSNVVQFYNELIDIYPNLKDVQLNNKQEKVLKKILKSASNPEFYTKDILEFFGDLDIQFDSLDDFKLSKVSNILCKYSTGTEITKITEKYKEQITKLDIKYQESIEKIVAIPNIKKESLDNLMDCIWKFSSTNGAQAFCTTFLTEDNNMHEIVVLAENFKDHQLIHELNHAIELHFLKHTDNGYTFISGFDKLQVSFNESKEIKNHDKVYRKNELFNEAINEFLTREIMDRGRELNINIQNNEKTGCGYGAGVNLAHKFISAYKQDLINCRLSDNPMQFADIIGVDNFNEISRVLSVFMSYKDLYLIDAMGSLEYKSGKSFNGLIGFVECAEELLHLDLSKSEKKLLESICEFQNLSESLIASKQEVKTG